MVAWIPYKSSFDTIAKITDGRKVSKVELGLLAFSVVTTIVNVGGASDLLLSNFGADAAAQHTATAIGLRLLMPIAADTIGKKAGMMLAGKAIRTGAKMIPIPYVKVMAYAPEIWDSINAIAELTMK